MFCTKCGKPVRDDDRFCRYCGAEIKKDGTEEKADVREENAEVMPDHEVTFEEEKSTVREENTEVMPDHEVTFEEESPEPVPTEDMILRQTMNLIVEDAKKRL